MNFTSIIDSLGLKKSSKDFDQIDASDNNLSKNPKIVQNQIGLPKTISFSFD
jgi:hypothetical protein